MLESNSELYEVDGFQIEIQEPTLFTQSQVGYLSSRYPLMTQSIHLWSKTKKFGEYRLNIERYDDLARKSPITNTKRLAVMNFSEFAGAIRNIPIKTFKKMVQLPAPQPNKQNVADR